MSTKLILVEGIPGSGKTTISRKIYEYLSGQGIDARLFNEGDRHPADLAWHACIELDAYNKLLEEYPDEKEAIMQQASIENNYAIIAYTKIASGNAKLMQTLESYELYDARAPFEVFRDLHLLRWNRFADRARNNNAISIFECAYFQNHVNELLFWRNTNLHQIYDYMSALLDTVKPLEPVLIYLSQKDARKTIERIAAERVNEQGEREWFNRCCAYLSNCPYGKRHNLNGFEDFVKAFEKRKAVEMTLLDKLEIESHVVDNSDYDWAQTWCEVQKIIDRVVY